VGDGGFIAHFLSKEKMDYLSAGYDIIGIKKFEEGPLPRVLFIVTPRKS
jgi:hypothetical protein